MKKIDISGRFFPDGCGMKRNPNGTWIRLSKYQSLETENKLLKSHNPNEANQYLMGRRESEAQLQKLRELVIMIYQNKHATWWMKNEINKQFPELVELLNQNP